ncbi:esterase [Rhodococcus sp. MS16]|uniref:NTE family protein n=1 Tax=Nocardia globerula TaxID=1818 RepID=A0A652YS86_NOCGL|nr:MULTISPECIES: patatin-like phospholipase family protein [Rhodococcus]MDV8068893.1 patatin-like phospholipase family protein [Rhodococcus sp. IEGM 1366]NMD61498.1 esterase [Nocardia globerula]NRI68971.1 esterase [Rhodococcus sp. MS16]PVX66951.1 NTE family protein [Rhodococcus globerulus]
MAQSRTVALALGSGGARGYAHIGVIQVLEERGYSIVGVAGSSMGALIGGLYAAGKLDEFTEWATTLKARDVVRLLDVSMSAPGAIHAEKVLGRVREILGETCIEDMRIPFTAVATDLAAGRSVWFQHGPVDAAIRASIAIPGVITPLVLNGRVLVDGGILDPLPVAPTLSIRADLTIGVSLGADARENRTPARVGTEPRPVDEWVGRFKRGTAQFLDRETVKSVVSRFGGHSTGLGLEEVGLDEVSVDEVSLDEGVVDTGRDIAPKIGRLEIMGRSLEVVQSALARYQLAVYPPDILIQVPRKSARSLDFARATEMIAIGRVLTESALDAEDF